MSPMGKSAAIATFFLEPALWMTGGTTARGDGSGSIAVRNRYNSPGGGPGGGPEFGRPPTPPQPAPPQAREEKGKPLFYQILRTRQSVAGVR